MNSNYGHTFYADRHQNTVYSARTVLSHVLDALPPVHSAIDFGCGVGTWLYVLKEYGITEILGLDGPWVDQTLLEIPSEAFHTTHFEETIVHERRYDLAITLEVAEHLSKDSASNFVDSLVSASDFVLFSAAIPFQGGVNHVNEQWPGYWVEMFAEREYAAFDFVRKRIWHDKEIPFWYRQNVLMFAKRERLSSGVLAGLNETEHGLPIALVHPDLFLSKIAQMSSVRGSVTLLRRATKAWLTRKINHSR